MSRFMFAALLLLACHLAAAAQERTVQVSQQFVDDAYWSFKQNVADRDTIAKQSDTIESQNALIIAQTSEIKKLLEGRDSRDAEIAKWKQLKCETTEVKFLLVYRKKKCE